MKVMRALKTMKEDHLSLRAAQEKAFAGEQAKYRDSMDKLNELFASEDTGVKGPLGEMQHTQRSEQLVMTLR